MGETARILIVDDDENIRKVLETILSDEGYTVETAETAKKAIEKSEKAFYNLSIDRCSLARHGGNRTPVQNAGQ